MVKLQRCLIFEPSERYSTRHELCPSRRPPQFHNLVAQHVRSLRPRGLTAVAFLSITLLAPCSHSPHRVETSRVEVPAKFMNEAGLAVQQVPAQALPAEWWTAYGDPLIDALVRNALEHNTDLAIARARIDEAVAITRRTRASMFPSLALTPQATRARDFSLAPTISSDARLPLSASWEVDLAGRLSHAADGARMDAVAVEQNGSRTRWQIAFETVSAALQQRQAAELEDLAKERLQVAERLERLTEQKFKAGQATGF
jgi:outer membrane protein TolC